MSTPTIPQARAAVTGAAAIFTTPDGRAETIAAEAGEDIRQLVIARAVEEARRTGAPVELVTSGDRGSHRLAVTETGALTPTDTGNPDTDTDHDHDVESAPRARPRTRSVDTLTAATDDAGSDAAEVPGADEVPSTPVDAEADDGGPATRASFITAEPRTTGTVPGWRGVLARVGIRIPPSAVQLRRAGQERVVSQHWAGCRRVAVVNGKGGVGKTMTTAMIAAVFARHGGGNVLAWDNNDTRGTLGWRTEQGLYDTTIRDLLPAAHSLLEQGAEVSDVSRFVHHQAGDRYDVLRSNPELLATDQRLTAAEFDLLTRVVTRYYRMIIFDSGNDESADRWQRMIASAHQLVIPTVASPESAESAALLLEALRGRDARCAHLADTATVVVTAAEPGNTRTVTRIAEGFAPLVRQVHTVPYDPALKSGPLRSQALRPVTRDAWLAVAATIAEGLTIVHGEAGTGEGPVT